MKHMTPGTVVPSGNPTHPWAFTVFNAMGEEQTSINNFLSAEQAKNHMRLYVNRYNEGVDGEE